MITIRDLQEQCELQGEVVVRQYNHDTGEFDFETPLCELSADSPALDRPIMYMFADMVYIRNLADHPVLIIELDGDYT